MRFINLTRQTEIGANSYLVEIAGRKIVLDAGLHPRQLAEEALPNYRHIPDESVSSIFISHAHQDHIGSLPVLMRRQPQARVFMTEATAKLSEVMLHNSVNVMTRQREDLGLATYPLFTHRETEQAAMVWHKAHVGQRWSMEGERVPDAENENNFEFFEAGHILGAAGILFRAEGKRIFYTGDVNFSDQSMLPGAAFPEEPLDVLIIETTRGDRAADPKFSRRKEEDRFLEAILRAFDGGGSVLVPVFALGKTQEVLTMLHRFRMNGALLNTPIWVEYKDYDCPRPAGSQHTAAASRSPVVADGGSSGSQRTRGPGNQDPNEWVICSFQRDDDRKNLIESSGCSVYCRSETIDILCWIC
jgi:Cft2 family RNA processing exonuclease